MSTRDNGPALAAGRIERLTTSLHAGLIASRSTRRQGIVGRTAALTGCALLALCADALAAPQTQADGATTPTAGSAAPAAAAPPGMAPAATALPGMAPASAAPPGMAPASAAPTAPALPVAAPSPAASPPGAGAIPTVAAPPSVAGAAAAPPGQDAQATPAKPPPPAVAGAQPPGAKRAMPDYDGRAEVTTAGDVLLWVPRVVFYPAYLVSEYVIRRPLGYLTIAAESGEWIKELQSVFTFGPNNNIGIVPTALIDFGFNSSIGVYFFYDDLGFEGNAFRVHAATGGTDWLRLTAADRFPLDANTHIALRGEAWTRPDWVFSGIGAKSLESDTARYQATSVEGGLAFHHDFGPAGSVDAYGSFKSVDFDDVCCDPTVGFRVANGRYPLPPAFDTGYTAYRLGVKAALDSRRPRPAPGHGARVEVSGEHVVDLRAPQVRRWVHYGATVGGFLDLTGQNRVVSLALSTEFSDPLGSEEVPFTELARLGGDAAMRGFREGRLRGRSAAALTLEYRYPIWAFLDGSAQVAVGNVFDAHLSDFAPDLTRLSFAFGVRTNGARDHSFDILIGSATETFQQGASLQELRFLFGATRGF